MVGALLDNKNKIKMDVMWWPVSQVYEGASQRFVVALGQTQLPCATQPRAFSVPSTHAAPPPFTSLSSPSPHHSPLSTKAKKIRRKKRWKNTTLKPPPRPAFPTMADTDWSSSQQR